MAIKFDDTGEVVGTPRKSRVVFDDQAPSAKQGFLARGWNALKKPEELSRRGLGQLAQMVPEGKITGNLTMDLLRGTPRIAANTLAQGAPGFVSREAILGGAAAKGLQTVPEIGQLISGAGRGLGRQLESASGIAPKAEGALESAYRDPSILVGKGRGAVSQMYKKIIETLEPGNAQKMKQLMQQEEEALQAKKLASARDFLLGKTSEIKPITQESTIKEIESFRNELSPRRMVVKAEKLVDKGALTPDDALEARKQIDPMIKKGKIPMRKGLEMRAKFDQVAKPAFGKADTAYQRALKSEALRNFLPQNKYGGTSPFKLMLMKLTGGLASPVLSPALQGAGSAGLGMAERGIINPLIQNSKLSMAAAALRKMRNANSNP